MTELRAPDPTLDALGEYGDVIVQRGTRPLPTAHAAEPDGVGDHRSPCGLRSLHVTGADEARWFAVPCRGCFPDAPSPGHFASCSDPCLLADAHAYLAWQVSR